MSGLALYSRENRNPLGNGGSGATPDLEQVLTAGNSGGAKQIKDIADGTDPTDAVTLEQLNAAVVTPTLAAVLTESNDGGGSQIKDIADGTDPTDAVTLEQLNAAVVTPTLAAVLTESNDAGGLSITDLANGVNPQDAATVAQLSSANGVVASNDIEEISADTEILTYANPDGANAHTYRVGAYVNIVSGASVDITVEIVYTDENGNLSSFNIPFNIVGALNEVIGAVPPANYAVIPIDIRLGATETVTINLQISGGNADCGATVQFLN